MASPDEPTDDVRTDQAAQAGRAAVDPAAMRQLADRLHASITRTLEDWSASTSTIDAGARRETQTFARPVSVPPVRMAQLSRTPEPTADLDDLVDLLVPRLLEKLVPALRQALRDDD